MKERNALKVQGLIPLVVLIVAVPVRAPTSRRARARAFVAVA